MLYHFEKAGHRGAAHRPLTLRLDRWPATPGRAPMAERVDALRAVERATPVATTATAETVARWVADGARIQFRPYQPRAATPAEVAAVEEMLAPVTPPHPDTCDEYGAIYGA